MSLLGLLSVAPEAGKRGCGVEMIIVFSVVSLLTNEVVFFLTSCDVVEVRMLVLS